MFLANPVFGVGVGNFTDHTRLTAHNPFALVLAETGIVGYTVWLAMVGYCFWMPIVVLRLPAAMDRSEEHTSELQSLMRISYAVFCLQNKTNQMTTDRK